MSATKEEVQLVLKTIQAIAEAIQGVRRVPSGHLYAVLMGRMSLDSYNSIIATLVRAKVVEVVHHEIIWIAKEVE